MLKRAVVQLLGRERANLLSAPYHDWRARQRTQRFLAQLRTKDLRVNIGCGPNPLPGWVNVDSARNEKVDVVWDLRRGLPFPEESCAAIFGEHVIEHMTKEDAAVLLQEIYRVLQQGGVVRLSTPDAARYLRAYAGDDSFLHHPSFELAMETPMDRVNQMMREGGQHLWTYDAPALMLLLRQAGFSEVLEQQFGCSRDVRMQDIDTQARAFESLYVEAVK
ncbi:MAG: methyltransferase domain-containing protein [Pyrinomonadaceae bacterium]